MGGGGPSQAQPAPERSGKGHGSWPLGVREVAGPEGKRTEPSLEKDWSPESRKGRGRARGGRQGEADKGLGSCGVCSSGLDYILRTLRAVEEPKLSPSLPYTVGKGLVELCPFPPLLSPPQELNVYTQLPHAYRGPVGAV